MQQISLTLKSFDNLYIKTASKSIQNILNYLNIKDLYIKKINLPNKRKKITLLKSPHIDKKARDQLQLKFYKSKLLINFKDKSPIWTQKNSLYSKNLKKRGFEDNEQNKHRIKILYSRNYLEKKLTKKISTLLYILKESNFFGIELKTMLNFSTSYKYKK